MSYHLFQFPLPGSQDLAELNRFLGSHRVVSVQQYLVATPSGGLLTFVVQTTPGEEKAKASPSRKIDYKNELTPEAFAVFSRLRDERKRLAEAEGVPVYTLFTNEQLAEMVRRPIHSLADLGQIPGIGPARIQKHGASLLSILNGDPSKTAPPVSPNSLQPDAQP